MTMACKRILWLQIIVATGSMLLTIVTGTISRWASPYMAQLTAEDSPLPINLDEASWLASLMYLSRLMGSIPVAVSVYYFGSKRALLFTGIPLILTWVSFILANSVWWLYVARLVDQSGHSQPRINAGAIVRLSSKEKN